MFSRCSSSQAGAGSKYRDGRREYRWSPWAARLLRHRMNDLTLARIGFFTLAFPVASWYSYALQAAANLGVRPVVWGLLLAVSSVASVAAMRWFLRLTARNSRRVSRAANLILPTAAAGLVMSVGLLATVPLLVVFGMSLGVVQLDANQRASAMEDDLQRPVLASCHGFFSLGVMSAGAIAYLTASAAGDRQRWWIVGSIALVAIGGWATRRPQQQRGPVPAARSDSGVRDSGLPALPWGALVAAAVVLRLTEGAVNTWHGALVENEMGLAGLGGLAYAAYGFGGVCVRFLADRARLRFGILSTTAVVGPVAVIIFAVSLTTNAVVLVLAGLFLLGCALGIGYPDVLKLATVGPGDSGGRRLSLVLTGGTVGSSLASPFVGLSSQFFSVRTAFMVLDAASALAFVFMAARYVRWRQLTKKEGMAVKSQNRRSETT